MIRALAFVALASVAFCGPAAALATSEVQTGSLPHGGTYFVATDPASPTSAIDLWFRAPDDGYGTPVAGLARVATTAAAAAKLASGKSLAEIVAQAGGRLTIQVFPDIIGVGIVVPPGDARMMLAAATAAYFAPNLDASALRSAQSDATVMAVQQQYESGSLGRALLFSQLFASGPAHEPPLPLQPGDLAHVTLPDVTAFAQRAFRASNAFVVLAGNVGTDLVGAVTDGSGSGVPDAPAHSQPARGSQQPVAQSGAVPAVTIGWIGPPIADERASTALDFVSDYLFRAGSGVVSRQLARTNPRLGIGGQFVTLNDPGIMLVTIEGSSDAAVQAQVLDAVRAMEQPLSERDFAAAREAFLYHLSDDTQTAEAEAANVGWYAAEGAPQYAPGGTDYDRIARSLDPEYVASVVRRYLTQPAIVRITESASPAETSS